MQSKFIVLFVSLFSCGSAVHQLRKDRSWAVDKLAALLSEAVEANSVPEPKIEPALDAAAAESATSAVKKLMVLLV
jgi:hypothetical protein